MGISILICLARCLIRKCYAKSIVADNVSELELTMTQRKVDDELDSDEFRYVPNTNKRMRQPSMQNDKKSLSP